jgi:hypothetical protein
MHGRGGRAGALPGDEFVARSSFNATLAIRIRARHSIGTSHAERHDDGLLHFNLPVIDDSAGMLWVFDVYASGATFDAAVRRIRRTMWSPSLRASASCASRWVADPPNGAGDTGAEPEGGTPPRFCEARSHSR